MLKKLFTAGILLCASLSMSVHAGIIKQGINGSFDIFGLGQTTLNNGKITRIDFLLNSSTSKAQLALGDYQNYFTSNSVFSVRNPLILSSIKDIKLWEIEGFSFVGNNVQENKTQGTATGLYIIGTVSHADFAPTVTEWFFSTQGLTDNGVTVKSFSSTVTSPAPNQVPESATLALLGLGLMGFGLGRKRKNLS